jgi:hypothetical protein
MGHIEEARSRVRNAGFGVTTGDAAQAHALIAIYEKLDEIATFLRARPSADRIGSDKPIVRWLDDKR